MDAVAAFVYSAGGAVRVHELMAFLQERPDVARAFYMAPARQLKKIFSICGAEHGLAMIVPPVDDADRSSIIKHQFTKKQRLEWKHKDIPMMIPRSLDAMEAMLRERMGTIKVGELAYFYSRYPAETKFMRRRSGSVVKFVEEYGVPDGRFVTSLTELCLSQRDAMEQRKETVGALVSRTSSLTSATCDSEEHEEPVRQQPIAEDHVSTADAPEEPLAPVTYLPPPRVQSALTALQVACHVVLISTRIFRSPLSPSASVLLIEIFRLRERRPRIHDSSMLSWTCDSVDIDTISVPVVPSPTATPPSLACDTQQLRGDRRTESLPLSPRSLPTFNPTILVCSDEHVLVDTEQEQEQEQEEEQQEEEEQERGQEEEQEHEEYILWTGLDANRLMSAFTSSIEISTVEISSPPPQASKCDLSPLLQKLPDLQTAVQPPDLFSPPCSPVVATAPQLVPLPPPRLLTPDAPASDRQPEGANALASAASPSPAPTRRLLVPSDLQWSSNRPSTKV